VMTPPIIRQYRRRVISSRIAVTAWASPYRTNRCVFFQNAIGFARDRAITITETPLWSEQQAFCQVSTGWQFSRFSPQASKLKQSRYSSIKLLAGAALVVLMRLQFEAQHREIPPKFTLSRLNFGFGINHRCAISLDRSLIALCF